MEDTMIDLANVELDSPTAYKRMTPEERVTALRDFRNFGTVEHPIFSFDFKCREDYVAANEQYSREHPDKVSFAPKGSAYAASLEERKKNPTITVTLVEVVDKTDVIPVQARRKAKPVVVRAFVKVRGKDAYKLNPKLKPGA
jgi:hypothetical protein